MKVLVAQPSPTLCDPIDPSTLLCPWNSSGKNTGVSCYFLLQEIFPTQWLNPSLLHCRQILYLWSHASQIQKKRTMSFSLWITLGWGILKDIRQSHWHQRDFENDHRNQMKANPESLGWRGAFSSSSSCKEMWNFLTSCHNVFKKPFSKWTNYPGRITH